MTILQSRLCIATTTQQETNTSIAIATYINYFEQAPCKQACTMRLCVHNMVQTSREILPSVAITVQLVCQQTMGGSRCVRACVRACVHWHDHWWVCLSTSITLIKRWYVLASCKRRHAALHISLDGLLLL